MNEITFEVERDDSGWLIASWDAPDGKGGIATQGQDLRELQENVKEAVVCHFEAAAAPASKFHYCSATKAKPILTQRRRERREAQRKRTLCEPLRLFAPLR